MGYINVAGAVFGIFAVAAAAAGTTKNNKGMFNAAAGLCLLDGALVMISVIWYMQAVGGNIHDLGIDDMVTKLADLFGISINFLAGMALKSGTKCTDQEMMKGAGVSIAVAILVILVALF